MTAPNAHVRVDFPGGHSLGPGKIALLEAVERTGSLTAAGRSLGMSYRRAWLLLHSLNDAFDAPAVELSAGGRDGGGARLTDFGRALVARYREFEAAVDGLALRCFGDLRAVRAAPPERAADSASRRPLSRSLPRA